jgi:hypothetical protein
MSPLQRLTHAEVFEAPKTETLKEYLQAGHGSFVGIINRMHDDHLIFSWENQ